jgi:hypothetical protein
MPDGLNRPPEKPKDNSITPGRIAIWVIVGIVGIVAKG